MALITKPKTFTVGATIVASEHNSNFDTIYDDYNGNITNANISGSAAIADSKLAQITTASKVSGAALTSLTSIVSGAGEIPLANIPTIPSSKLSPGAVAQVVNTLTGAVDTGTTVMPKDDTIPQNTEGDEYMTLTITPKSATNKLLIQVIALVAISTNPNDISGALFQDSTASAIAAIAVDTVATNSPYIITFNHFMTTGTTSATTFKLRMGAVNSGTLTFNGDSGARLFGGVSASSITITEVVV